MYHDLNSIAHYFREFDIKILDKWSEITDSALDEIILNITTENRNLGYRAVLARLRADGIVVQEEQVRVATRRVDSTECQRCQCTPYIATADGRSASGHLLCLEYQERVKCFVADMESSPCTINGSYWNQPDCKRRKHISIIRRECTRVVLVYG